MKLKTPITADQRTQLTGRQVMLRREYDALKAARAALAETSEELAKATAEFRQLKASRDASRKAAQTLSALQVQIPLLEEKEAEAEAEVESLRRSVIQEIRSAAAIIKEVCQPLAAQFDAGLRAALAPFVLDPAMAAHTLLGNNSDGKSALINFLQEGEFITKEAGFAEIELLKTSRSITITCLLEGREVWSLHPEDEDEEAGEAAGVL